MGSYEEIPPQTAASQPFPGRGNVLQRKVTSFSIIAPLAWLLMKDVGDDLLTWLMHPCWQDFLFVAWQHDAGALDALELLVAADEANRDRAGEELRRLARQRGFFFAAGEGCSAEHASLRKPGWQLQCDLAVRMEGSRMGQRR